MKVLITGAAGQVGRALTEAVPPGVEVESLTRAQLDIADAAAVSAAMQCARPDLVINAAAYTAVDLAEKEAPRAHAINSLGPAHLAEAAARLPQCRLLHISTDYVFDGTSARPYVESDPVAPLNVYGQTKLGGEQAVARILGHRGGILRTSWVYAPYGRNFLLTMLRLMGSKAEVRVVADQVGCPTAAASVARALWRWASLGSLAGILHWTDRGSVSWYQFACQIADFGVQLGLLAGRPTVLPIGTIDYPTPARRPPNSVLDGSQAEAALDLERRDWTSTLFESMQRLAQDERRAVAPSAHGLSGGG